MIIKIVITVGDTEYVICKRRGKLNQEEERWRMERENILTKEIIWSLFKNATWSNFGY